MGGAAAGVCSRAASAGCSTELAGGRMGGGGAGGWGRRADLVQQRDHLFLAPLLLRLERIRLEAGTQTNTQTNTQANKAFVRQDGRAGAGCVAADGGMSEGAGAGEAMAGGRIVGR